MRAVQHTRRGLEVHRGGQRNLALVGHPYRHGAVPFRHHPKVAGPATQTTATSANNLNYGGAATGAGVTTDAEKVYLVFWGGQWGTQSTNGSGYAAFSGDSAGVAPDLQAFFKGLGTGGETWSGGMTQYCNGLGRRTVSRARQALSPLELGGGLTAFCVRSRLA